MGAWRVDQHYGVGVANVRLHAEPYLHPERRWTLWEGVESIREELHDRGQSLRRALGVLPGILLGVMVLMSFVMTVVRDRIDDSGVEVVLMASAPPLPEVIPEPVPIPEPEPVKPVPPPPAPVAKPTPKPPPVVKPPPRPEPVRLAQAPPPKPPPPKRNERMRRPPPPKQTPQRRVRIDSVAQAPDTPPPTAPTRVARNQAPRSAAARPQVDVRPLAGPAPDRAETATPEPRRFAAVRPPSNQRSVTPNVAPALSAVSIEPDRTDPAPRSRRGSPSAPSRSPRAAAPRPALAALGDVPVDESAPSRPARSARAATAPSARSAAPRPDVRMAAVSNSAPSPAAPAASTTRSGPAPRHSNASSGARQEPGLAGVPLGSLASCLSDREEDALKQRIVAAVTTQKQCVSRAGSYRFIETKNLNSFLMWVDRAPTRKEGDRCDELRLALECLASQ